MANDSAVDGDDDFDLQASSRLKPDPQERGGRARYKRLVLGEDIAVIDVCDRADLHAELDDFLDNVARKRPLFEDGEEHTFLVRGGCASHDEEGHLLTSFSVETSTSRQL